MTIITDWWLTYPSEKWRSSSVGMMTFPIYGKINMFQTPNQFLSVFLFAFQAMARLQCVFHSINMKGLNKARINVLPITKQDAIEYVAFSCAHKKPFCFHKKHIELSSYNQLWQHPPDQPKVLRAITAQKKEQKGMWPPISPHFSTFHRIWTLDATNTRSTAEWYSSTCRRCLGRYLQSTWTLCVSRCSPEMPQKCGLILPEAIT